MYDFPNKGRNGLRQPAHLNAPRKSCTASTPDASRATGPLRAPYCILPATMHLSGRLSVRSETGRMRTGSQHTFSVGWCFRGVALISIALALSLSSGWTSIIGFAAGAGSGFFLVSVLNSPKLVVRALSLILLLILCSSLAFIGGIWLNNAPHFQPDFGVAVTSSVCSSALGIVTYGRSPVFNSRRLLKNLVCLLVCCFLGQLIGVVTYGIYFFTVGDNRLDVYHNLLSLLVLGTIAGSIVGVFLTVTANANGSEQNPEGDKR